MLRYLIGRVLSGMVVLLIVSVLAFGLDALTPGDPAQLILAAQGLDPITPADVAQQRAVMKLDDPLPLRYGDWLWRALHGDFGYSFRAYRPVSEIYLERFPATLALGLVAALLTILIAVPLGTLAAYKRGKPVDHAARLLVVSGAALPGFWISFVLILVFAATLKWLPAFGTLTPQGIVMPAAVLALPNISLLTRLTRAATLDTKNADYTRVARAKGLAAATIAIRHVLPNAFIPILTVFSLELAYLLTGSAVVEFVFSWPGVGRTAVDAALYRDTPVLAGCAVAAALIFVLVNLFTDVLIMLLDPRTRRPGATR